MRRPGPIALACSIVVLAVSGAASVRAADDAPLGPPAPPAAPGSDVRSPLPGDPDAQTAHGGKGTARGGAEILWQFPPEQPDDRAPVRAHLETVRRERPSGNGGLLKTLRAVGWAPGEARLLIPRQGERAVHEGDVLGTDTVTRVEDHRLRLTRPDPGQPGPAFVVVSFDARGEPFVRVYSQRNPPLPDPGQNEAKP
jgi:hypothetical protein